MYIDLLITGAIEQCQHKRVRDETREQTDFEGKIIGSWDTWHWSPSGISSCWRVRCSAKLWGVEWVEWWSKWVHGSLGWWYGREIWVRWWCHLSQTVRLIPTNKGGIWRERFHVQEYTCACHKWDSHIISAKPSKHRGGKLKASVLLHSLSICSGHHFVPGVTPLTPLPVLCCASWWNRALLGSFKASPRVKDIPQDGYFAFFFWVLFMLLKCAKWRHQNRLYSDFRLSSYQLKYM